MKDKLSDAHADEICARYLAGESTNVIARDFDVYGSSIVRLLKRRGIARRPSASTPHRNALEERVICDAYAKGASATMVAKEHGISVTHVGRLLRKHGYQVRSMSEVRRIYSCDHQFFKTVDTEVKAYWLGFIAADGYVSNPTSGNSPEISINLSIVDQEHLERFRHPIKSNHPIRTHTQQTPKGLQKEYASLAIRSKDLADDLRAHGIVPAKTHTLKWPTLRQDLYRHFLRGYTDGDGGFYAYKVSTTPNWRPTPRYSVTSNHDFCLSIRDFLVEACNLRKNKLVERPTYSVVIYTGRNQTRRIYNLLYENATIHLPRKRQRIAPHLF